MPYPEKSCSTKSQNVTGNKILKGQCHETYFVEVLKALKVVVNEK
jgi:hypothetical protein